MEIESEYDHTKGFTVEDASPKQHEGQWTCEVKPTQQCTNRPENFQQFIVPPIGIKNKACCQLYTNLTFVAFR